MNDHRSASDSQALPPAISGARRKRRLTGPCVPQVCADLTAFRNLYLTYVGHSPVPGILVHNSYIYIDQGVYPRPPRRPQSQPPTVIDHGQFSSWLHGVTSAWRPAPVAMSGAGIARTAFAPVDVAVSAY